MKAKLLLLLCCLFAIEGWANSNDIHLPLIPQHFDLTLFISS